MSVTRSQVVKLRSPDGATSTGFLLGRPDILVTTLHGISWQASEPGYILAFGESRSDNELYACEIGVVSTDDGELRQVQLSAALVVPGTDVIVALLREPLGFDARVLRPGRADALDGTDELSSMGFCAADEGGYPLALAFAGWRNDARVGEHRVRAVMKLRVLARGELSVLGLSGAPVVDAMGEVVAVITSSPRAVNELYATSIDAIWRAAQTIAHALADSQATATLSLEPPPARARSRSSIPLLVAGGCLCVTLLVGRSLATTTELAQTPVTPPTSQAIEPTCSIDVPELGHDRIARATMIHVGAAELPTLDIQAGSRLLFTCPEHELVVDLVVHGTSGRTYLMPDVRIPTSTSAIVPR